ncbi:MAG: NAD(P)-dependent oxidoreductase [Candidatus Dadabacteria bacterium]|nr:MAG: NAD(P)-dependent oxidoreductase [Candidatus Dadabacteria bacterium]
MDLKDKTIAVTGASGMIGVYICRELLRRGARVIGVVRNPDKAAFLAGEGVTFRRADLADRDALTRGFDGCDAVVSNAAMFIMTRAMADWDAHMQANVEGTRNVYEAMRAAGVTRAVQVSTCGVYRFIPWRRMRPDSPQIDGERRQGGPYRATKQVSEKLAWTLSDEGGIGLTVVRPSGVYGARDANAMPMVHRALRFPGLLPVPTIIAPMVHAADVAIAIAGALENDASSGKAYVTGGPDTTLYGFMRAAKRAAGRGPLMVPLPTYVGFYCDNSAAERDLGFSNRPFEQGFREIWAEDPPPWAR